MGYLFIKKTRVGVTKAPFANFSVSKIFDLAKVTVRFLESHSYLTGVAAAPAKYKRDIQQLTFVLTITENVENNGTERIGLVTPTPVSLHVRWKYDPL